MVFNVHAETHAGDDVNALTGFSPGNAAMLYPNLNNDTTAITQAMAIQMVDEQSGLVAGKINAFDLVDMVYHTGRGIDGFMNSSLVMPFVAGGNCTGVVSRRWCSEVQGQGSSRRTGRL